MEVTKKVENFLKFLKENYGETISSLISYSKQSENLLIKETKQSDYSSKITHSLDIFSTMMIGTIQKVSKNLKVE